MNIKTGFKKLCIVILITMILFMNFNIYIYAANGEQEEQVTVEYEYKEETNTVVATIKSTVELKPTKISWKLSEDGKEYTFEFNANTTYTTTVTDINGNIIEVLIEVTEIKDKQTKVTVEYEYKEATNTVVATIKSTVELKPTKVSWKLSEDGKEYTFEFNANTTYTTTVTDVNGNVIPVPIEVTQIKEGRAGIQIDYKYQEKTNTVLVSIISTLELKPTKVSWKLSEDRKKYTFEFDANTTYTTTVTDINGNVINVPINVTEVKEKAKINVTYVYNAQTNVVVATINSTVELKPTKVSWKLSDDRKKYTFEFNSNTTYTTTVEDINGNIIEVPIKVERNR